MTLPRGAAHGPSPSLGALPHSSKLMLNATAVVVNGERRSCEADFVLPFNPNPDLKWIRSREAHFVAVESCNPTGIFLAGECLQG